MLFLCATNILIPESSQWKELIPLVSPIVVICLFIIDRIIGFYFRKREVERNWYLKVLIEPGINKISVFFKNTLESYKLSAEFLDSNKQQPHDNYSALKSKEFGKFQSLKRELEAEVVFPVQITYPLVGEKVMEELRNLEDKFTSSLDNEKFSEVDIKQFHLFVAANRALILKLLYSPLQTRFLFFKRN